MYLQPSNSKRGFTLVEIIVVMAIIGILSAVVYASFGDARRQSRDKAIKAEMEILRLEARLYFERYDEYSSDNQRDDTVHECSGTTVNMGTSLFGVENAGSATLVAKSPEVVNLVQKIGTLIPSGTRVYCGATQNRWAFAAPLNITFPEGTPFRLWCVDSAGAAKEITVSTIGGAAGQSSQDGLDFADHGYSCP